jgi:hypothetical protein
MKAKIVPFIRRSRVAPGPSPRLVARLQTLDAEQLQVVELIAAALQRGRI